MTPVVEPQPVARWRTHLAIAWALLFAVILTFIFFKLKEFVFVGWRGLNLWFILMNVPAIAVTFLLAKTLMRLHPVLAWKPSDLFFRPRAGAGGESSLLLTAMRAKFIGPIVTLLLLVNLPVIAMLEEFIFRQGTDGWTGAVWRSALFGLAHLGMNIQLGASLAIGCIGLWFSAWYFRGGLELAAAVHFAYILPIVALGAVGLVQARLRRR